MKKETYDKGAQNPINLTITPAATPDWGAVIDHLLVDVKLGSNSAATGQIQWFDLDSIGSLKQNVSNVRWGSGVLIDADHFITAGHCFDVIKYQDKNAYYTPYDTVKKNI